MLNIMCTFCSILKFRHAICKYGSGFTFIEDGKGAEGVKICKWVFLSVIYCVTWPHRRRDYFIKKFDTSFEWLRMLVNTKESYNTVSV